MEEGRNVRRTGAGWEWKTRTESLCGVMDLFWHYSTTKPADSVCSPHVNTNM